MADAKILASVKDALGNTGTYQDGALNVYIDEVIAYMVDAGVPESVAKSTASAGVIALGVTDLQYRGGKLSEYFYQRLSQLNYEVDSEAEALKKEIAALQEQIATEQKEIEALQRELETAQSTSNNLRAEITDLESQIATKQVEIEALTQEKAVLELLVDELRAENENLKAQAEVIESQYAEQIATLEQEHAAEVEALERTHAEQVAELEEENATIAETSYNDGANAAKNQFGIPNEVKGTGIVTCDYVNENEHNVKVKLSSDTVTDFSGREVKVIGKNFYTGDDIEGVKNSAVTYFNVIPKGNYTISANVTSEDTDNNVCMIYFYYVNGGGIGVNLQRGNRKSNLIKFANDVHSNIAYASNSAINSEGDEFSITDIQLELLEVATDYQPHTEKTYTANADGTVDGITSISPTMNIICEGMEIAARYYQSPSAEYDMFWDIYQDYGNRKSYRNGFYMSGWNDKNYNPKYPIIMAYADYGGTATFNLNKGITDTKVDIICPDNVILTSTFYNAANLKTIRKLVVNKEVTYSSTFNQCRALENITFEGVIGNPLNFSWSTLLTHDSLMSIINALEDKSEDTSGTTWTLTIGSENLAKLDEQTELAIAWQKGWSVE